VLHLNSGNRYALDALLQALKGTDVKGMVIGEAEFEESFNLQRHITGLKRGSSK
jgi:hypothetical protein